MDGLRYSLAWALLFCLGCTARDGMQQVGREAPKQFAALARLQESHHAVLQEELSRLEAEHGLPQQATTATTPQQAALARLVPADRLPRILKLADRHMQRYFARSVETGALQDANSAPTEADAAERQLVTAFLREQEGVKQKVAAVFADDPLPEFQVPWAEGPLADFSFLGVCRLGHHLLALEAVQLLAADQPAEAAANVRMMLRMAQVLAAVPHATPRLAAVELRREALELLAHVAQHPALPDDALAPVRQALDDAIAHWPDDALAWRGERASTLVAYEIVAEGQLLSLVSSEDLTWLRKRDQLSALVESVNQNWEYDAAFYLTAQRELIAACAEPYYARRNVFARLDSQLQRLENTAQFPRLAAEMFLADMERGHRLQALDWAHCEAWSLAFSQAATAEPNTSLSTPINPVTGQPFTLSNHGPLVVVGAIAGGTHDEVALAVRAAAAPVAERVRVQR